MKEKQSKAKRRKEREREKSGLLIDRTIAFETPGAKVGWSQRCGNRACFVDSSTIGNAFYQVHATCALHRGIDIEHMW